MPSLRDLQQQFLSSLLADSAGACSELILARGIEPPARIGIYRNNAREGFVKALTATFPVIAQLAGEDWFRQTALAYMRAHPSVSGNLHYVGRDFATFLDHRLATSRFNYFADVARLEWAYQEVLVAADHPSFDLAALGGIAPEDYGALRFDAHPALRLVTSPYPLLAIWQAHKGSTESPVPVHLDAGPSRLLIIRPEDHVELRELPASDFALLDAFARGATFEAAADAALDTDSAVDLSASLTRIVTLGAFVDFHVATISFN